jgi:glycosyltransferase involved in cell wall biosynthesis
MTQLIVDARALQDPDYSLRGIGQHARCLLTHGRSDPAVRHRFRFVAVTDADLPPLSAPDRALFDEHRITAYPAPGSDARFLSLSPMTHSPLPFAQLLGRSSARPLALVYDFIPLQEPERYLANPIVRMAYTTCLSWLPAFRRFFPISGDTRRRLIERTAAREADCHVTGVAVRQALQPRPGEPPMVRGRFVLVIGGGDPRKNPEVAVDAHAASARLASHGIALLIAGNYPPDAREQLRRRHMAAGGRGDLLQFADRLSDEEMRHLYRTALVTIAPSRMEGFSIPITEAAANGCPVVATDCPAQAELLPHPDDVFGADDPARLAALLERLVTSPGAAQAAVARQSGLRTAYTPEAVGQRFWQPILAEAALPLPPVLRGALPHVAVLSPLPPAASGCADYTAATLATLAKRWRVTAYTDTPNARPIPEVTAGGPVSALPYLDPGFDAVVSVIGNSHFHVREFDTLLRYGAAAIAHDARMINFYAALIGMDRTVQVASAEMQRAVTASEIVRWLHDQRTLPALFLSELAAAARPLMVHSPYTADQVRKRYGTEAALLPYVPHRVPDRTEIAPEGRRAARARLALPQDARIVATFGYVSEDKAPEELLWAAEMLTAWRMPVTLAYVGQVDAGTAARLRGLANEFGLPEDRLILFEEPVGDALYRDWLAAADVGVQLRTYQLGGLSGALLDCMAAGLPSVTNVHLAEVMDAPDWVGRIPDGLSAVLLAERIGSILDRLGNGTERVEAHAAFLASRNMNVYCERLAAAVGLPW